MKNIGILALQGNYKRHKIVLRKLGVNSIYVRYSEELKKCDGLIIPGGESTSMSIQINRYKLRNPLIKFGRKKSIFGTCAGMIMLSKQSHHGNVTPLGLMDFSVCRNAWGRQVFSFSDKLTLKFDLKRQFNGIFIRAPKISKLGDNISILATYRSEPVMITDGMHYVSTFHPEIGADYRVHSYYLEKIYG